MTASTASPSLDQRIAAQEWRALSGQMDHQGWVVAPRLLSAAETSALSDVWETGRFRSRIVMERYGFGKGEYRYFAYPLPDLVQTLRSALYPHMADIANGWNRTLRIAHRYPTSHAELIDQCREGGQTRPTPLMLDYNPGDYCCLHQDLYGALLFPIQAVVMLSRADAFTGGEFMLVEQGRTSSRADVVPLDQGDVVFLAVNERPVPGLRGAARARMRHGVSALRSGHRRTLGVIFHDAR